MQCSVPPPLNDDQLSAALDGSAEQSILDHLARCPVCAVRLNAARRVEQALHTRFFRWDCPALQQLSQYHWAMINQDEDRAIRRHLELCVLCAADLEELRSFLASDRVAAPVPMPRVSTPPRSRLGEVLAHLLPRAPALTLRGGPLRLIEAEVDGIRIALDPQPAGADRVTLIGMLAADDQDQWTGALVELRQAGALVMLTTIDDLGGFQCGLFPTGPTELRITPEHGAVVVVPEITL